MNHAAQGSIQIIRLHRHPPEFIIFVQICINPLHLFIGKLQIHPIHRIHQIRKGLEINHRIPVYLNPQILLYRFQQKLRPAEGISRVQPVAVPSGDVHIHVPQQRRHMNRPGLTAHRQKNHSVRPAVVPFRTGITAD